MVEAWPARDLGTSGTWLTVTDMPHCYASARMISASPKRCPHPQRSAQSLLSTSSTASILAAAASASAQAGARGGDGAAPSHARSTVSGRETLTGSAGAGAGGKAGFRPVISAMQSVLCLPYRRPRSKLEAPQQMDTQHRPALRSKLKALRVAASTGGAAAAEARSQVAAASDMFRSSRPANMHQPSGGVRAAGSCCAAHGFPSSLAAVKQAATCLSTCKNSSDALPAEICSQALHVSAESGAASRWGQQSKLWPTRRSTTSV